jgi:hypothetical protein
MDGTDGMERMERMERMKRVELLVRLVACTLMGLPVTKAPTRMGGHE